MGMSQKQKEIRALNKTIYVQLGQTIDMFPSIWEMKVKDFNARLGDELGYDETTVQGYTTKNMSSEVECSALFAALGCVMLSSIVDKTSDIDEQKALVREYMYRAVPILFLMAKLYSAIEFFTALSPFLSEKRQMERALIAFCRGSKSENITEDYLRECLNRCSRKCPTPKKIIDTWNEIKNCLGEDLLIADSVEEAMEERAREKLKFFYADIINT